MTATPRIPPSNSNWTPIGTEGPPFVGTFDGNGQTVSGIYCSVSGTGSGAGNGKAAGFFGAVNGTVKNLTVENSFFNGEYMVGAIVGHAGDGSLTIENCVNKATVAGVAGVGGIFGGYPGETGQASTAHVPLTGSVRITGSVNYGAIYGSTTGGNSSVGGIVGSFRYMGESSIAYCVNYGNITSNGGCVGGILGQTTGCIFTMTDCINTGNVNGDRLVGGIIGKTEGHNFAKTMKNLINTGTVTASTADYTTYQSGPINGSNSKDENNNDNIKKGHTLPFAAGPYYYLEGLTATYGCGTGENDLYTPMPQDDLDDLIAAITVQIPVLQEPPTDGNQ